jgi:hypothetical protein
MRVNPIVAATLKMLLPILHRWIDSIPAEKRDRLAIELGKRIPLEKLIGEEKEKVVLSETVKLALEIIRAVCDAKL